MTQVERLHQLGELTGNAFLIASAVKVIAVFTGVMVIVAMLTLLERKIAAWMQDRLGPNRVGPSGLLQPVADGIKNILKEETFPAESNRTFFIIAPMLSIIPALVTFAVIPFAAPLATPWGVVPMVIADVPVGVLFLIAFSSLGVYGIVMAGWASNNKYALLGGLRAGAQMISYEIPLGLSLLAVFFLVGNVRLTEVVHFQQEMGLWFALPLAASFFFFWVSTFAETNRLPFDLPEAEEELVTGFHTEYSSMKFSAFMIAEYAHVFTASALMATLFLGGWDIPFTSWDHIRHLGGGVVAGSEPSLLITLLTFLSFLLKTFFFILVFMLVRWTVPRFRYDQVMDLGWKVMIPAALAVVVITAGAILGLDAAGVTYTDRALGFLPTYGLVLTAVNLLMLGAVIMVLDRGRALSGSGSLSARRRSTLQTASMREAGITAHPPRAGVAGD